MSLNPCIVVGYTPTPEGRAALVRGIDESRVHDAELVVVISHEGGRSFTSEDAVRWEHEIAALEETLTTAGIRHQVRGLVRGKEPVEDLVTVAEETEADFIIIGLRRRSPVGKLLLGSNAQDILLRADCPVLAVKAEDRE